jgi:hypothetical protein
LEVLRVTTGADDELQQRLSPKDFVIYVPLFGSALAISWEIGSFVPIGGSAFGTFSLTEHIAFALQALPLAFVFATMPMALYSLGSFERLQKSLSFRSLRTYLASATFVLGLIAAAWLGLFLAWRFVLPAGTPQPYYFLAITAGGAVMLYMLPALATRMTTRLMWLGLFLTFAAYGAGVDQTRARLHNGEVSEVETNSGKLSLIVLRANSSATFGLDPATQRFVFIKGDRVKERSWSRAWQAERR